MVWLTSGDVRAFELFYDRHNPVAFGLAMRVLNNRGLAAEATQDAFLEFWRHRGGYRPDRGAPRSWLMGIVRHRAIDALRRERRRRGDLDISDYVAQLPGTDDVAAQAISRDEAEVLHALLAKLPAEQRRVIELAYFARLTHIEIAKQLGLPLGTTKGRMRLGLSKLRTALDDVPG